MVSKLYEAFFEAIKQGDVNSCKRFIKRNIDLEKEYQGKTPLFYAAQNGQRAIVRLLLENNVKIGPNPESILDIIEQDGPGIIRAIECYDGNTRGNFAQEGINYDIANKKLELDSNLNLANVNLLIQNEQKIPLITHHIYFTFKEKSKPIDKVSLSKTLKTFNELDKSGKWVHYFWTNDPSIVPLELKDKVEVRLVSELENSRVYKELINTLNNTKDKSDLVGASDIARLMIIEQEGGFYLDLDYEIYNAEPLYNYSKAFNFIGGKEADEDASAIKEARLIGNSFLAASAHHPIFVKSLELTQRNFAALDTNSIPQYINMPCSRASEVAYKAGGPVITTAYFLTANKNTVDVVLNSGLLYNYQYAWSITPDSICHRHGVQIILDKNAIGADMFCGGWTNTKMIYYPQNLNAYLFESALLGYTRFVKYFYEKGAKLSTVNNLTKSTPLYAASQLGYKEIVEFIARKLNEAGEDIDAPHFSGATALYTAVDNNHVEVVKTLLTFGASVLVKGNNLARIAKDKGYFEIYNLLKQADIEKSCYIGETPDLFVQEGINYFERNANLDKDANYKLIHLQEFISKEPKIPLVTHHIYFTSKTNPKAIESLSVDIAERTLNKLNAAEINLKHYIWTNNFEIVPERIKNIPNVEIHLFSELESEELYEETNIIINGAENDSALYAKASDFARAIILRKEGGIYLDWDYEFYRFNKFIPLLYTFNFIGGKEFLKSETEPVFIGNAQFSASPNHPILNEMIALLKRNFYMVEAKDYVKYPCTKVMKVIYESGPAVISMAALKYANQDENNDIILPAYHLFNMDIANYLNPKSLCHIPGRNLSLEMYPSTYGGDLMCGAWHKLKGYEDRIYYSQNFFNAVKRGNVLEVKQLLNRGFDINSFDDKGTNPIHYAARNGDNEMVRFLLEQGASLENGPFIPTIEENIMEILLQAGDRRVKFIGCYNNNDPRVFAQEGIDIDKENKKLIADSQYKRENLMLFMSEQKVPNISHQIYFTSKVNPKKLDNISIEKIIINAARLNELAQDWKHIIWTSDEAHIPVEVKNILNVEVRLISELKDSNLYSDLLMMLAEAEHHKKMFVASSDLARLIILSKMGGVYHDLDYEIFRPEKLLELMKSFHFFSGKEGSEFDHKLTLVGNSMIASIPNHPVIEKTLELAYRNLHLSEFPKAPDYSMYPCGKASELVFKAGAPILTAAYLLNANKHGYIDVVMPYQVFYDYNYIRSVTPESPCHIPGKIENLGPDQIGADMFCGSWYQNHEFENLNYYPKNNELYLFEAAAMGYTRIAQFFIYKGTSINSNASGATPLYIAAQNGHLSTVKALLKMDGIDINKVATNNMSPLYVVVINKHYQIIKALLEAKADVEAYYAPQKSSAFYLAVALQDATSAAWLLKYGANKDFVLGGKSALDLANDNNQTEIVKMINLGMDEFCKDELLDSKFLEVCGKVEDNFSYSEV